MNILFITLLDFKSYSEHNIYCDLLREFINNGDQVYCISPTERKNGIDTHFEENNHLLKLKIGNIQKTNFVEKGISTLLIEFQFTSAIKNYFSNIKFDLVLYATPPITLVKPIKYIKKRDNAKSYLLLKDIFPQNAVDIGLMKKSGLKGLLYCFFRNKEKRLYTVSDKIGCMSQANVDYILKNNIGISPEKVEICPNCVEFTNTSINTEDKISIKLKYNLPLDKKIFVYGGNLGKPQGIPFIIDCMRAAATNNKAYFLIVGDGTEYALLENFTKEEYIDNFKLIPKLPKDDYDVLVSACDVGLIFLDYRFTIPNFPSRLLSYMQSQIPVLACTDVNTDIGKFIVDRGFGWWCESKNTADFIVLVEEILAIQDFEQMKEKELIAMKECFSPRICYRKIKGE